MSKKKMKWEIRTKRKWNQTKVIKVSFACLSELRPSKYLLSTFDKKHSTNPLPLMEKSTVEAPNMMLSFW